MRCEDIHESIQEQEERLSISAVIIIKNLRYIIWLKHWYNVRKNISRTAVKWKFDAT